MFVGREAELRSLNRSYVSNQFEMTIIYGRRRVGKSTLIKEFIRDKKAVYYSAVKTSLEQNVRMWGEAVLKELAPEIRSVGFSSIEGIMEFILEKSRQERIIIVLDELPYLAEADESVLSVLQNMIDNRWQYADIQLILCGSSISFMEDKVLSEKSPLFGRRTAQIHLKPFSYLEASQFVPSYSLEEKAICYGVTGGIAKYLALLNKSKTFDENMIDLYFDANGYLYEEPQNLLTQEFRNVAVYNEIIQLLAEGANKVSEIADKSHLKDSNVIHILHNLIGVEIAERQMAITNERNGKKVLYALRDGMFTFWYRFVQGSAGAVEMDKGATYYYHNVKPFLHDYMGTIFEQMCRYYTLRSGLEGQLACPITKVGKWWGSNPQTRKQTDIDVVGLDTVSRQAVLGECKFKNKVLDKSIYEELLLKDGLIDNHYHTVQYLLFSLGGFSDWLQNLAARDTRVKLFDLTDLYSAVPADS